MGWILAILTGVLSGFAYPARFGGWQLPDLGFLGFIAYVPLFYALRPVTARRAFLLSATSACVTYGISMYWLYTALHEFGHLSPALSVLALGLLIIVLAAYFGLIFYLSQRIALRTGWNVAWIRPFVWIAVEYLRGHVPTGGFPWSQLAYTQGGFSPFIQAADLFAVFGLTFVMVLINEALTGVLLVWKKRVTFASQKPIGYAAVLLFAACLCYGIWRLHQTAPTPIDTIKVGMVQGNIPQDEKWLSSAMRKILATYQEGTKRVEARGAQLVLWPEAAFPLTLSMEAASYDYDFGLTNAHLLMGAVTRPSYEVKDTYFNSALLLDSSGAMLDYYHKRHLVPFGEYVPWKDVLFFAKKMTHEVGNVKPGDSFHPIRYQKKGLGVLICYEDIFPEIAREMVESGAQTLINLTNDAWYGWSSAAYQHVVFSQFRSIETRRAMVRATNTGISAYIDRWGRVVWHGKLFVAEEFVQDLPLYTDRSPYTRIGDVFPIVCLGLTGLALVASFIRKDTNPIS